MDALFELLTSELSNKHVELHHENQGIPMESISIRGLKLYYDREERDAVDEMVLACDKSVQTITEAWQLKTPKDCRVYILSSWPRCVFLGAPLGSQILLGVTLPFWYREFKQRWIYSGGWSQRYGDRQVVGIKSPRLIAQNPDSFGESIFIKEDESELKVLSIVCHELTHAYSSHLHLPTWMHEGLAMVSADRCLRKMTVLPNTLQLLQNGDNRNRPTGDLNMMAQSREEIILLYVRGYWLTRYLTDTRPELVKELLKKKYSHQELEGLIASSLEIQQDRFWPELDRRVLETYHLELT